jgi:nucleotide-binding universal stress UspA family protein
MGILSQQLFTMIVAMAVITTLAMPPMLRWALRQVPLRAEERARIERERFEERSRLAGVERVLVAVDAGANAQFTSRLVGLFAGFRGIPATVLHIEPKSERSGNDRESKPEAAAEAGAAIAVESAQSDAHQAHSGPIDIISRSREVGVTASIVEEAKKGYGLLAIGFETVTDQDGGFHRRIAATAAGFDGPLMIVRARGRHLEEPETSEFRIILPVTGTEVSQRAAEIAVALARAANVPIIAIHASSPANGKVRSPPRGRVKRAYEDAVLQDVLALARRYGASLETAVRADVSPEDAITGAAEAGRDLIIMGANRRAGSPLNLGEVAASLVQGSKASVALITN